MSSKAEIKSTSFMVYATNEKLVVFVHCLLKAIIIAVDSLFFTRDT